MDQQTKAKLKQDHFIETTTHGIEWASENRRSVLQTVGILLGAIILIVAVVAFAAHRSAAADAAFGAAISTYQAPVLVPGQPADPGVKTYSTVKERAQAANAQFLAVANQYGSTEAGKNARYFAGLTYLDMGENSSAESTLQKVASGWDKQLSSLAKEALADLYHQTGRDPQAIELYNYLTAHPTDAVPAGLAQIQLAELYSDEGKIDQAHKIYAQLKDKQKPGDKGSPDPAAQIAAQKLNPTPPAGAGAPQL